MALNKYQKAARERMIKKVEAQANNPASLNQPIRASVGEMHEYGPKKKPNAPMSEPYMATGKAGLVAKAAAKKRLKDAEKERRTLQAAEDKTWGELSDKDKARIKAAKKKAKKNKIAKF